MNDSYDVIVIGGGTAGVIAAVQAARAGADTLLVEKNGMLGGTITNASVNYPGLFHARERQVIAGIGWDLVVDCLSEMGASPPDFSTPPPDDRHYLQHIHIDRSVFAMLCDEYVLGSGADLLLHAMIAGATDGGDAWHVTLCAKTGLVELASRVFIDCTGDANAVALAGFELVVPDELQPATYSCVASGYDVEALDLDAINARFDEAVSSGELSYTDASWNTEGPNVGKWLRGRGVNSNHIHEINAGDSGGRTQLEVEGRRSLMRLFRFLKKQPGLEGLTIEHLPPECGVRETVTIVGETTVTAADYEGGRAFDDAVCYSYYPIDLHTSAGGGLSKRPLAPGIVPTIPRGAMIPAGSRNVLVAGRCVASDREANSALRVQATCMATGQAAGAMATLAVEKGLAVGELDIGEVRALLKEHGAIVP